MYKTFTLYTSPIYLSTPLVVLDCPALEVLLFKGIIQFRMVDRFHGTRTSYGLTSPEKRKVSETAAMQEELDVLER